MYDFGYSRIRPTNREHPLASVHASTHPLILSKLAGLRDSTTSPAEFRRLVRASAMLLAAEATADLALKMVEVTTPLAKANCRVLACSIAVVPVLRAGLGWPMASSR